MLIGFFAVQLDSASDHRSLDRYSGSFGANTHARGVSGRRSVLVEVVDGDRVPVVGGFGQVCLFTLLRLLLLVASRVEEDVTRCSRLDVGDLHPDKALVHHRVELLDLRGEQRLVVTVDKAQIGTILFGCSEVEVPVVQTDDNGGGSHLVGDRDTVVGRVDRELLARTPRIVPPRACLE